MDKRDKIDYILSLIKDQTDEFLESEELTGMELSAEEIVIAAIEYISSQSVTRIEYGSPIATVDRSYLQFMLDDENSLPIWGDNDED